MPRFDEQMSTEGRFWRVLGATVAWVALWSVLNDRAVGTGSTIAATLGGVAAGITLVLLMTLFAGYREKEAPMSAADNGALVLVKKYLPFALAGLVVLKMGYDAVTGIGSGNLHSFFFVGFVLGLLPLLVLNSKPRAGGKA